MRGKWPDPDDPEKQIEGIIDGRDRLAACELAKLAPRFERFAGENIEAFILTTNVNRRHLTNGQQSTALAFTCPEPQRGRGNKDPTIKSAETADFSHRHLRDARPILRHSREMAMAILAGGAKIDEALKIIEEREQADAKPEARIAAAPGTVSRSRQQGHRGRADNRSAAGEVRPRPMGGQWP